MKLRSLLAALCLLAGTAPPVLATDAALFHWFEYTGRDPLYAAPLPAGSFHNPVLAGYYPDPSVTRVGDKYYLVNSTFTHWPGIPIHESTDLVHWKLVGHALSDPSKVNFDGLRVSAGVFAPAIEYHDGTFYVINTLVDSGGNFFVTAKDPRGPWSDPVWLKEIDGIDPSFFFDEDGKAYVVNNGPPEGTPLYDGHRAIWIQEFDVATQKLVGPRKVLVNGGTDLAKKPIWIEGPHLYRINGAYYLMCAEGGTGPDHSEVIFRAKSPWGPFEPYAGNPILTQRDLPTDRPDPITNAGHADLVRMQDGSWWALFLASQPYRDYLFNTGRETFLLPVTWKDGWPVILGHGQVIPTTLPGPKAMKAGARGDALAGNFTRREDFKGAHALGPEWITVYTPHESNPVMTHEAGLFVAPVKDTTLADRRHSGFIARRQQHQHFDASTELLPTAGRVESGLAAFQNDKHWYFLGQRLRGDEVEMFVRRAAAGAPEVVARKSVPNRRGSPLRLRISGDGGAYSFYYDAGSGWQPLLEQDDASFLSTEIAGGFVGTVIGPYAQYEQE
ncbi:MAG TPA: glycoside hydrolase family 43 protein [Steroidobacteraceae bacterium]|nr:glycoside hydrolase family 43 protein [Steroidobacteraceae bacterium]